MRSKIRGLVTKPGPPKREDNVGVAPVPVSLWARPTAAFLFTGGGVLTQISAHAVGEPVPVTLRFETRGGMTATRSYPDGKGMESESLEVNAGTALYVDVPEGRELLVGALFTPRSGVRVKRVAAKLVEVSHA